MTELKKKPLFNPEGDLDVRLRRMISVNTTSLNDFNNMKYAWISDYIRYLGNLRWTSLGYPALYPGFESEPELSLIHIYHNIMCRI